jgi:hypothetical protein
MWLFFPFGFVSAVHKPGDAPGVLCVRARDELSLDNVRARCPALGPTIADTGTDYPFRAYVQADAFGAFVGAYIGSIDFNNFKDEATRQHGHRFHDACMKVWSAMHDLTLPRFDRKGGGRASSLRGLFSQPASGPVSDPIRDDYHVHLLAGALDRTLARRK